MVGIRIKIDGNLRMATSVTLLTSDFALHCADVPQGNKFEVNAIVLICKKKVMCGRSDREHPKAISA